MYAWIAVFVLPLNSAINPVLYTISTATFLGNVRKRACRFRKSFTGGGSYRSTDTKHSIVGQYVYFCFGLKFLLNESILTFILLQASEQGKNKNLR